MPLPRRKCRRMYAVSCQGVGLIAGTLAYSRKAAISHFLDGTTTANWEMYKQAGYRTVQAMIKVISKGDKR